MLGNVIDFTSADTGSILMRFLNKDPPVHVNIAAVGSASERPGAVYRVCVTLTHTGQPRMAPIMIHARLHFTDWENEPQRHRWRWKWTNIRQTSRCFVAKTWQSPAAWHPAHFRDGKAAAMTAIPYMVIAHGPTRQWWMKEGTALTPYKLSTISSVLVRPLVSSAKPSEHQGSCKRVKCYAMYSSRRG